MTARTKNLGDAGEIFAANYLENHGYKIITKNFRVRSAEIDIVAEIDDVIVFVEVKTRSDTKYGLPSEAVNFRKQQKIIEAIDPIKDCDGFTSYNFGRLALGYKPYSVPCTPKGIIKLLEHYNIEFLGKHALVIGRSNIVGKPISILLQQKNATVTMAHSHTKNLKDIAKTADIIVSAVGKPNVITQDYIKSNAVIVDVGINRTETGLKGDVDFSGCCEKAGFITPVPGGIGPMTIAMLMENTFELYKLQRSFSE
mgnify:CR=1 FL=1